MTTSGQPSLEQRVLRFIREQHLLSGRQKIVVAVSGGPDSVCLLHILVNLRRELGLRLHAAHLNHQLRGAESEADARYVADLARRLDIPVTIEQRDVKAYQSRHRLSPEEAAREVRYAFLAGVAGSVGAERAAVGHTVDDHIETILMHLIRGSGTRGLRGLQPLGQSSGLTVIRPLLEISRQETNDYCRQHRLAPRLDASNLSLSPLRNRIRLQLLPRLKSYNPQITRALLRTARIAADDLAFLDTEVSRLWGEAEKRENTIILNKAKFVELPPALKRHLLRAAIEELLGNLKDIEARHIEEIMDALDKPAGKRISLPAGLHFFIDYDKYLIGPDPVALSPLPILEAESLLQIPGKTRLPGWCIEATVISASEITISARDSVKGRSPFTKSSSPSPLKERGTEGVRFKENLFSACFDFNKTGDRLMVRRRQPGDWFQPLGMSQPKKLGEFMIDAKIPRDWRQRVPIVSSSAQVLWVAGWRIDDRVKVTGSTKQVLCLKMAREQSE